MTSSVSFSRAGVRSALALSMAGAAALACATAAALLLGMLLPPPQQYTLGSMDQLYRPEPRLFSIGNHEFYLVWNERTPVALSTSDPHGWPEYCRLRWWPASHEFVEPCGGSVYQPNGAYVRGPSPRAMDQFDVSVESGQIQVNLERPIKGQPHA